MQLHRKTTRYFSLIGLLTLGCGGGEKPAAPGPEAKPAVAEAAEAKKPEPPAPPKPEAVPVAPVTAQPDAQGVVHLTGSDLMRYSATRIELKAGDKLKLELKNAGALPKEVMGHDFVLLKPGSDVTAFAAKAMGAKTTDYIPADAAEMLAHTKLLGPGESDTIEVTLPGPGTYPYLCTFPGHVGLMNGQLVAL
ncbi:MAG: plastocyanin/azurin family copper-binding protein [Polyangiales bacterium]